MYSSTLYITYLLKFPTRRGGSVSPTEYISLQEMKQGQSICPHSWSVHCNFTGDGKCNERGWACTPHPHQARLILPLECTPESRRYYSVYSVVSPPMKQAMPVRNLSLFTSAVFLASAALKKISKPAYSFRIF